MQAASWGTPDKILRGLEARRKVVGDFEMNVAFRFGGTPYEVVGARPEAVRQGSAAGGEILEVGEGRESGGVTFFKETRTLSRPAR